MEILTVVLLLFFTSVNFLEGVQKEAIHSKNLKSSERANKNRSSFKTFPEIRFVQEETFRSTEAVIVGDIAKFAADGENRVYIADSDQTTIHVFDPDGSYLTSLGREGKGPGEFTAFRSHTSIKIHSNRLYVTDVIGTSFFPDRIQVFLLEDLSFSHTIKLLAEYRDNFKQLEGYYPKRIYPFGNGRFLVSYHRFPNKYKDNESYIRYVIQDSTGYILTGPILEQKDLTQLVYKVTNVSIPYQAITPFPFFGKSLLAVSHEDHHLYAVPETEEFKLDVYKPDGKYLRSFQHSFENKSLTREGLIKRYGDTMSALGPGTIAADMIREAQNLPDTWPALNDMLIDDENRLWISTIVEDDEIYEWWVLKDTGELLARFDWPRNKEIKVVKNGKLYTEETDKNGLARIGRYSIEMREKTLSE